MCICALLVYVHYSLFNLLSYIQMCLPMWRIKKMRYELQTVMILLINKFPSLYKSSRSVIAHKQLLTLILIMSLGKLLWLIQCP